MKHTIYISLLLVACLGLTTSCDITRKPYYAKDQTDVNKDPEKYAANLMSGTYAQLKGWSDAMHRCGEYAGDNIMIRGASTDPFFEFITFSRTPNNGRLSGFWDSSYKAIAQSSNLIKMFEEGKSAELDHRIGECYFIRGLMYFYLVRAYGRPYFQNPETNLGVPLRNGTEKDPFAKLPERATVKEVYEQVIADLEKSIQLMQEKDSPNPSYASKEAAKAILSRVYLYMSGTYEAPNTAYAQKAVEYANAVIQSGKYSLLPREQFMKYNTFPPETNKESILVVKRLSSEFSGYDHYYGVGGMYAVVGGMGWGEMYASKKYLDLLDETGRNDWAKNKIVDARAAFIEPQYTEEKEPVFRVVVAQYGSSPAVVTGYDYLQLPFVEGAQNKVYEMYTESKEKDAPQKRREFTLTPKDEEQGIYTFTYTDGKVYQGVKDYRMKLNRMYPMFYITKCSYEGEESHLHSPVLIRLGELYLNKAEAEAKLGKYAEALQDLNVVRTRSLPGKGYTELDATNAAERIDKERQLELAFQAERSYDVFRNGKPLTRHYPGAHNAVEDIPATDYRVVYYIPESVINTYKSTGSTITQNPTSN